MLIGLTIILFVVSLFLIAFRKYKKQKIDDNKILKFILDEKYVDFFVNICITIIGVTLAILLTNYDSDKKDVKKTISLLASLERELKMVEDNIEMYYIPVYEHLKEQNEESKFLEVYNATPVSPLYTLESIMGNELVVTNVNYYSYAALVDSQRSICAIYKRIEVYDEIEELVFELDLLKENVAFMRKIIQNEIDFQNGEISEKSMRELVNGIYEEEYLGSEK